MYEALRAMVMSGEIGEGDRVPESRLAQQLGVSRTPVREALQRLESDGLIHAQGRGVRLRLLSADELRLLYLSRAGLEGWAAFLVAHRVADGEVAPARLTALGALATETHELTKAGDLARAAEANRAFHESMVALAENPFITSALHHWWDRIIISTRRSLQHPDRTEAVHREHDSILDALHRGDASGSRAAVETHALATSDALDRH